MTRFTVLGIIAWFISLVLSSGNYPSPFVACSFAVAGGLCMVAAAITTLGNKNDSGKSNDK